MTIKKKAARGTTLASRTRPSRPQTDAERVRAYNSDPNRRARSGGETAENEAQAAAYRARQEAGAAADAARRAARTPRSQAPASGDTNEAYMARFNDYIKKGGDPAKWDPATMARGGTVKKAARGATVKKPVAKKAAPKKAARGATVTVRSPARPGTKPKPRVPSSSPSSGRTMARGGTVSGTLSPNRTTPQPKAPETWKPTPARPSAPRGPRRTMAKGGTVRRKK